VRINPVFFYLVVYDSVAGFQIPGSFEHIAPGSDQGVHQHFLFKAGDSFSQWPGDALPREEVFAIALQALMDEFGLTLADLTAEPFLYGYNAESDMKVWQLDFACQSTPMEGTEYTVYVRDCDGAVLGVWGPEESNG